MEFSASSGESTMVNPMKTAAGSGVGFNVGAETAGASSPTASMSTPRPVSYAAGLAARFSTAQTQMTGEGLVEYGIFMDPKSLTKIPKGKGCWGKFVQCVCTCVGGYENNRLKHMKEELFPKLDGPVYIYDINSKEGDTFVCMNNRDMNGNGGVRREVRVAGGLFQKNVLYKLLAKEQTLVPNADWAEEHERSEINEILTLLQLTGAIAVNYEHRPSATQIGDILDMPVKKDGGALTMISAYVSRFYKMFVRSAGATAGSALRGQRSGAANMSSLSGRVLYRSNERPMASLDGVIADMGRDFHHTRSQPAVMAVLKQRMGRGIQMAATFTFKHYAGDSTWLEAMHTLQVDNLPKNKPGIEMEEEDVIDCGFRSGERRKRYETVFTVIFPDVKDGADRRQGGADVSPDAAGYLAGAWHPQSHLVKLDMPLLIMNGGGGGGAKGSKKGGKKSGRKSKGDSSDEPKAAGGIVGMLRRLAGGGKGGADGGAEEDEEEEDEDA
jgi:hypothetical protein